MRPRPIRELPGIGPGRRDTRRIRPAHRR
ncbi:hypothetical protein [Streptomyces sp. NPDC001601]